MVAVVPVVEMGASVDEVVVVPSGLPRCDIDIINHSKSNSII